MQTLIIFDTSMKTATQQTPDKKSFVPNFVQKNQIQKIAHATSLLFWNFTEQARLRLVYNSWCKVVP